MLGDRRPGHVEIGGDVANRAFALGQHGDDGAPRRVGERTEDRLGGVDGGRHIKPFGFALYETFWFYVKHEISGASALPSGPRFA